MSASQRKRNTKEDIVEIEVGFKPVCVGFVAHSKSLINQMSTAGEEDQQYFDGCRAHIRRECMHAPSKRVTVLCRHWYGFLRVVQLHIQYVIF